MGTKNIILFIHSVSPEGIAAVRSYAKRTKQSLRIAVLRDAKKRNWQEHAKTLGVDIFLTCDFFNPVKIEQALLPYKEQISAVTCRGEANVQFLAKVIPHVPYVRTPTESSLSWSTDKIMMRQLLRTHDPTIAPRFTVVSEADQATIKKITDKVGFPLVLKPAGLAASLLVSVCYHPEELTAALKLVFKRIEKVYKEHKRFIAPKVLVEQFMEGELYSIDVYVNARGKIYTCPLVHVKTGRAIGFDDFFGYQRQVPTPLAKAAIETAEATTRKAIHALGLRSTTAHIELMRTEQGWKVVELGPRMGGFRHILYRLSYGIDHAQNDLLIRLGERPVIPRRRRGFAMALQFYAKEEGRLSEVKGLRKVQNLTSFVEINQHKYPGDRCLFAKHGGGAVCDVVLFNKNRSDLLADVRRTEQAVVIRVE